MKTKSNRKALQEKLNQSIGDVVKSLSGSKSKKINKSIKKASKLIAKAIVRHKSAGAARRKDERGKVARRKFSVGGKRGVPLKKEVAALSPSKVNAANGSPLSVE